MEVICGAKRLFQKNSRKRCLGYIPRYQIFFGREEEVDKLVQHWQEPTTLWSKEALVSQSPITAFKACFRHWAKFVLFMDTPFVDTPFGPPRPIAEHQEVVSSSGPAARHPSESRMQYRGQHLASRRQRKCSSSRTHCILPASLQHYGQSTYSKLCQRWSSASRRHFGKDQKGPHKRGIHDQGDFWKFLLETTV